MTLVFLDTETTGLDPDRHEVWEIAYAVDDGPILSSVVDHEPPTLQPDVIHALRINGYLSRYTPTDDEAVMREQFRFEDTLKDALKGATVVASNPSFDTAMLRKRWGCEPWHHRKLDLASFALPLELKHWRLKGLYDIAEALGVQAPDHTAAGDVHTLRECYRELSWRYSDLWTRHSASKPGDSTA